MLYSISSLVVCFTQNINSVHFLKKFFLVLKKFKRCHFHHSLDNLFNAFSKKIPPLFSYANFQTYKKVLENLYNEHPYSHHLECIFCIFLFLLYMYFMTLSVHPPMHLAIYQSVLYFDHFKMSLKYQHTVCCLSKHFRIYTMFIVYFSFF